MQEKEQFQSHLQELYVESQENRIPDWESDYELELEYEAYQDFSEDIGSWYDDSDYRDVDYDLSFGYDDDDYYDEPLGEVGSYYIHKETGVAYQYVRVDGDNVFINVRTGRQENVYCYELRRM